MDEGGEVTNYHRFGLIVHSPMVARVILVAALALTAAAWYVSHEITSNATEEQFIFRTEEIEGAISSRMDEYVQVLWGGVGLFNASGEVSREEWHDYVSTLDLDQQWPGIQGMGYAVPFAPERLGDHIESIRAEGFPDYTVNPQGTRDQMTAIVYLEPFNWRNQRAFGFDMYSNEVRREAMDRAMRTGEAATSGVITLVQETEEDVQRGFLTYLPVYDGTVAESTDENVGFDGWVYAAFRMNDLMDGILGSETREIDYDIYDGNNMSEESLLFSSDPATAGTNVSDNLDRVVRVDIQGRTWSLAFRPGPDFGGTTSERLPSLVAAAGITIDILLFWAISSLGLINKRAKQLTAERTAELDAATKRLEAHSEVLERQARDLQRSNSELAQFAHAASHDLQEPLRTMGSYASLLEARHQERLPEEARRWLHYISTGSERMASLIRNLLEFSATGSNETEFVPSSLDHALDAAIAALQHSITESGAIIERDELPIVLGSSLQMERVLQNLLSNAIKYRREGEPPYITVSGSTKGALASIEVRDNGIGISPENHDRVFEVFRRAAPSAKYEGNGIGLALCRRIVEGHGGQIGVRSTTGHGSTFWFTVPLPNSADYPRSEVSQQLAPA